MSDGQPFIVTHQEAARLCRIEPRDLKRAGERHLIAFHTHSASQKRPHRYYLREDVEKLAKAIARAGCLEKLLTSSPVAPIRRQAALSRTGTRTPPSGGRTGDVYDFAEAVARTTGKQPAR